MKWLPLTLGAQLFVLILAGFVATNLTVQLLSGRSAGSIHQLGLEQILKRYVADARVLAACSAPCNQGALAAAMATDDLQLTLQARALPQEAMDQAETRILNRLRGLMGAPPAEAPATVQIVRDADRHTRLRVSSRLPDGQWLIGTLAPVIRNSWWKPLGFSLLASCLPILVVLMLFLRHMLRPLRTLSEAAERFSRGERLEPLPATGPRELRELAQAFNQLQERLTRFVDDRTRMIAAISHDFRTPITSLRLRAELVDDAELRQGMTRTLEDLRQMVEETLHFARDDSRREDTRSTDLVPLLQHLIDEHRLLGHTLQAELPQSCPYRCRPLALTRAVQNLIDNAIRHAGNAHLRLEPGATQVHIHVEDNGPGLPAAWLEKAFEPFTRHDHARGPGSGSSGLGLSIARSCVEAHGGQIRLHNRPEGGLRATISLPA